MIKGFKVTETIAVGLINCYQCHDCQRVVDCLTPPESGRCPDCRGEEPNFEKVRAPARQCDFCDHSPAPHRITRLTPEQRSANQAWSDSLKEAPHTGHCPHLELPTFACQSCYDAHPETHLPGYTCGSCKHWCWGGHHGHPSECEHPKGIGQGGTTCCTPGYNDHACHRYEKLS